MVKGLDVFREFFTGHENQFVLIGGTAATLAMEQAGLNFRATKDLDIVLHVEAIDAGFGARLWSFIERGGYEIRQASDSGKPVLYRFQKPGDSSFPAMLELFCRAPEGMQLAPNSQLTRIPIGDSIASLSAIILDDDYYAFIVGGSQVVDGLPWIGAEQLIPLKARAWLDLSSRKQGGESIDGKDIRKHGNDVMRLSQLLTEQSRIELGPAIARDMRAFLSATGDDNTYEPKQLQIKASAAEVLARVASAYSLDRAG
jgi:hypothetical protein